MFEQIILDTEQIELLSIIVEAVRGLSKSQRDKFVFKDTMGGSFIIHGHLQNFHPNAYRGDLEILHQNGLINLSYHNGDRLWFDVTPIGFRYYEHIKIQQGEPIKRIQQDIRDFLSSESFKSKYPSALAKWSQAEQELWSADSQSQLSIIGHLCRESVQEFVNALVAKHSPPNCDSDKSKTISRLCLSIT